MLLFLLAVSLDSFSAGFSYGTSRVHIQPLAAVFLIFIPSITLTLMSVLGTFLFSFFSPSVLTVLSFLLLSFLGLEKLLESLIRCYAQKYPNGIGKRVCKIKQLHIIFTIYFSPQEANTKDLQVLSAKEAFFLSLALSLDSMVASMAFSCQITSLPLFFLLALLFHFLLFFGGYLLGELLAQKSNLELSWLSGLFLLLIALGILL